MLPITEKPVLVYFLAPIGTTDVVIHDVGYHDFHTVKPSYTPRYQDAYTIHYILHGRGTVHVGEEQYLVSENQLFFIRPDELFYYYPDSDEPWDYVWFGFSGHMAENLLSSIGFSENVRVISSQTPEMTTKILAELFEKLEADGVTGLDALAAFYRLCAAEKKKAPVVLTVSKILSERAADIIRRNIENPEFRIATLAEMVHLCPSYLTRVFRSEIGMAPVQFLIGHRMAHAASLLTSTGLSVGEIALKSGYSDEIHFSKCFRRRYGLSPRDYRKQQVSRTDRDTEEDSAVLS